MGLSLDTPAIHVSRLVQYLMQTGNWRADMTIEEALALTERSVEDLERPAGPPKEK